MTTPPRVLDAHAHLWTRARTPQPWIDPQTMAALDRDFGPEDLVDQQRRIGITDGAVLVQSAHSLDETRYLLSLVDSAVVRGVVGWVDLTGDVIDTVQGLGGRGAGLVGIRHLAHQDQDPQALLRAERRTAFTELARLGLPFDIVVRADQLDSSAIPLVTQHPGTRFVLDHLGNPPLRDAEALERWRSSIVQLAERDNVLAKLSGLALHSGSPDPALLAPAVDVALETFGPGRLLFGTDWPVVRLAGGEEAWLEAVLALLDTLSPPEREAVLRTTATRVYGLEA